MQARNFPAQGLVTVSQITIFAGIHPATFWRTMAKRLTPVAGFEKPRRYRAEDVWRLLGYERSNGEWQ